MGDVRIGIVGSRKFGDLPRVTKLVGILYERFGDDLVVVSGGAVGVDTAAEQAAKDLVVRTKMFKPQLIGKTFVVAAKERNTKIVAYSKWVFAFWSCKTDSTGTVDTMHKALMSSKLVGIYTPKGAFENSYTDGWADEEGINQ